MKKLILQLTLFMIMLLPLVASAQISEKEQAAKIKSLAVMGDSATLKHCSGGLSSEIKVSDLAFRDEAQKKWTVEPGDFILHPGNSSRNICHQPS